MLMQAAEGGIVMMADIAMRKALHSGKPEPRQEGSEMLSSGR
jgi:hypothetical protein